MFNSSETSEAQRSRAQNWVLKKLCGIATTSFTPGSNELTAFNEGRRFVGLQLVNFLTEPMDNFRGKST